MRKTPDPPTPVGHALLKRARGVVQIGTLYYFRYPGLVTGDGLPPAPIFCRNPAMTTPLRLPDFRFLKTSLSNGLDVILRREDRLPVVAMNLWYHVGSKNEERGQRGFAHLFEHLMFEGS